jgi:flagellin
MSIGDLSRINTNVQSMKALGQLNKTNSELGIRQMRLATGSRLNRAEDDSAGYSIAKKLQATTRGQAQALSNIGDAKGMLTVGEGALNSTMDILQTMKEKAVQAANDTMGSEERTAIQSQLNELSKEVSDVLGTAEFNGTKLFTDDTPGTDLTFQVGAGASDDFDVNIGRMSQNALVGEGSDVVAPSSNWAGGDINVTSFRGGAATDYVLTANTATANIAAGGDDSGDLTMTAAAFDTANANAFAVGEVVEFRTQGDVADLSVEYKDANGDWQEAASGLDLRASGGGNGAIDVNGLSFQLDQTGDAAADTRYSEGLSFTVQAGTLTDGAGETTYDAKTATYTSNDGNLSFQADTGDVANTNTFTIQADAGLYVDSNESAQATIGTIDAAISKVSESLSGLGDAQARLTIKQDNLDTSMTNYEAARSRIEDTDFAKEQMEITKLQILQQTGIGSLAQANAGPQSVLSLIG